MDGWPYVGGGAFCRPVGCADPFPMPGRDRDFSARRVLAMRAILSPPRKLWNIRRLAVAASGRRSMAHPPHKGRPLPLWSHFPPHPPNSVQLPHAPVYGTGLVCVAARKGIAVMRVMRRNAASTKPHFSVALEEELHPFRLCSAAASVCHCKTEAFSFFAPPLPHFSEVFANWLPARYNKEYL